MDGKRIKSWGANLGWVLIAIVMVLGVRAYTQRGLVQGAAPAIDGIGLAGERISLAELRGGPVLVHFWATWCPLCRGEQGSIDSVAGDYPVITIAMQSGGTAQVAAYVREHGLRAPVVVDESGELARAYGVRAVPTSLILDRDGVIRHVEVGYTTEIGLRARLWLAGF